MTPPTIGRLLLALLAPAALPAGALQAQQDLYSTPIARTLAEQSEDVRIFESHLNTLANPFFEGRAPGTRGNDLAAEYLQFHIRLHGLEPAFPETITASDSTEVLTPFTSYYQPFQVETEYEALTERAEYTSGGRTLAFSPGVDFNAVGFSGSAAVEGAPLVFVGYSIPSGPDGYLSYESEPDLTGKVALVLRFEPMDDEGDSLWTGGAGWSFSANLEPKIRAAATRGASAVILVNPPGVNDPRADRLQGTDLKPRGDALDIPVLMMSQDAADRLVRAADSQNRSLMDLRLLADAGPAVLDLPTTPLTIETRLEEITVTTNNVGGIVRGKGALADEYIVLGAHYDHIGYGYFSSRSPDRAGEVHPGADDNASGTAALLLLAERLRAHYDALPDDADARSLMFLWFTAEEGGLIGSRYYVNNPPIAKDDHAFMLNLDMIGRLRDEGFTVSGTGTAEGLAEFLQPHFEESGLNITSNPSGSGPSDHANFNDAGIPVLFFFTGLHDLYHHADDTPDLIHKAGAVRVADLAQNIALALATRSEPWVYSETTRGQLGMRPRRGGMKVRFGIRPESYGSEKGILLGDVYDGTTAADAGLQAGDLIVQWDEHELTTVEDWMPILGEHEPGDEVELVYIRDGEEQTTTATLKAPEPRR